MNRVILLAASTVFGSRAFSTAAAPLNPDEAAGHIGETATVCGVVIYGENRAKFGTPETGLRGKRICVTGQISDYQGEAGDRADRAGPVDLIIMWGVA